MERQSEADLAGKVVVITGASRGLGRQAALDFARRGASVMTHWRTLKLGRGP
jgi:NAD(P)-dependent dehydrogenase (short-subunit alcohol dehydrogenase family)